MFGIDSKAEKETWSEVKPEVIQKAAYDINKENNKELAVSGNDMEGIL